MKSAVSTKFMNSGISPMRVGATLLILSMVFPSSLVAQTGNSKPELFTSYFGVTAVLFKAHIPAETCLLIIRQADDIVLRPDGLKTLSSHHLQTASLNLRVCATSAELARADQDLAVGLYGEAVSELERRERLEK